MHVLGKNAYSAVLDETVCISINLIWADVSFKASVSLLMFCLNDLSIDVSGMLNFHTVIGSVSSFISSNICFIYLGAPIMGIYIYIFLIAISCCWRDLFFIMLCPSLSLITVFALK